LPRLNGKPTKCGPRKCSTCSAGCWQRSTMACARFFPGIRRLTATT